MSWFYLHSEESDAGEKIHSRFEVTEASLAAGWEVILHINTHEHLVNYVSSKMYQPI